jgi:maleylacetoacetate isomerase
MLELYSYFRSSASYRVRIALNLKGLPYAIAPVHLLRGGGEQHQSGFFQINPARLVPAMSDGQFTLTQSLAILEYIEEAFPSKPALLPADALGRARVRALALTVACEIHPLNNLRVLQYLKTELGVGDANREAWYRHWTLCGFSALEELLAGSPDTGIFCHGDTPGIADCCLVPQVFNARRFHIPLTDYPSIVRIDAACMALESFRRASPEVQPDSE